MEEPETIVQDPVLVEHERSYKVFNVLLRWCMVALGSGLLFLTLWFATTTGFFGALIIGIVVFVLGYYLLVRDEEHHSLDVSATDS